MIKIIKTRDSLSFKQKKSLCIANFTHCKKLLSDKNFISFRKIREDPSFDEDNTDSQEVLDDVIIRVTAREYLDTVKVCTFSF